MFRTQGKSFLKGVVFYLDIQDQKILNDTSKKLRYFGAQIATFLSNYIKCFVTDQLETALQSQHPKFKRVQTSSPLVSLTSTPYQHIPTTQEPQNSNNFNHNIISNRSSKMLRSPQFNHLTKKQQTPISIAIKLGIQISSVETIRGWLNKNLSMNKFSTSRILLKQEDQQKSNEKHNQTKNENYHLKEYLQMRNSKNNSVLLRTRFANRLNSQPRIKKKRSRMIPKKFQKPHILIRGTGRGRGSGRGSGSGKICQLQTQEKKIVTLEENTNTNSVEELNHNNDLVQTEFLYPYIYIESNSPHYQPAYKEFSEKKIPETRGFYYKRSKQRNKQFSIKFLEEKRKIKKKPQRKKKIKGSGFCVICNKHYTILDEHVLEQKHQEFAKNDDNYRIIENLFIKISKLDFFGNDLQTGKQNLNTNVKSIEKQESKLQKTKNLIKNKKKSNSQNTSQIVKNKITQKTTRTPKIECQETPSTSTGLHLIGSSSIGNQNTALKTQSSNFGNEITITNNLDNEDITNGNEVDHNYNANHGNQKSFSIQTKKQRQMIDKPIKNRKRKNTAKLFTKIPNITHSNLDKEKIIRKCNNNNLFDDDDDDKDADYGGGGDEKFDDEEEYGRNYGDDNEDTDDKNDNIFIENVKKLEIKIKKKKLNSSNDIDNENEKYIQDFKHHDYNLKNEIFRSEETQKFFTLQDHHQYHNHHKSLQKLSNEPLHRYFPIPTPKQTGLATYLDSGGMMHTRTRRKYIKRK
ncbi:activator of s-phase kinase-related [Anaeramoeba flamelloides]|uniref:Activator of s-phase kinase-related n=1 Tax=Anaeramoeba flamelloides TaxID=1746091 RepID=A0AAV7Z2B5_9EUKA|nr:activator of s-phase kinase-related [Anaeramoeba flamelloides]